MKGSAPALGPTGARIPRSKEHQGEDAGAGGMPASASPFEQRMRSRVMASSLKGRVALVTGGGRGLGEAICRNLAVAGATIVAGDINTELAEKVCGSIRDEGRRALALHLDVTSEEQADEVVRRVAAELG